MNPMDQSHYHQQQYSAPSSSGFAPQLPHISTTFPRYPSQPTMPGQAPPQTLGHPGPVGGAMMANLPPMGVAGPVQTQPSPLEAVCLTSNGRRYRLEVIQEPQRARMCGFGDKDRRPITPPPCVKLTVFDSKTNKEIPPDDVDPQCFILTVDLWDERALSEVNLVRHSNSSPAVSISASTSCAYPPPPERPYIGLLNPDQLVYHSQHSGYQQVAQQQQGMYGQQGGYGGNPYASQASPTGHPGMSAAGSAPYVAAAQQPVSIIPNHSQGMYTRNLIGGLAVNAVKLKDDTAKLGLWFVLQDLSVRTEGAFRLKFRFVNVARDDGAEGLNMDHAPVLASCFSDTFQVYSAKKFPGVVESTPLSRAFASQGIKIPIRKDGGKIANMEDYEEDDRVR